MMIEFLLADAPDVRNVAVHQRSRFPGGIVEPLVQTQVLAMPQRIGRLNHDRLKRVLQHHRVMPVGAGDADGDRIAAAFGQRAAFRARFGSIRGVFADMIPPKRALPIEQSADCHSNSTRPSRRA